MMADNKELFRKWMENKNNLARPNKTATDYMSCLNYLQSCGYDILNISDIDDFRAIKNVIYSDYKKGSSKLQYSNAYKSVLNNYEEFLRYKKLGKIAGDMKFPLNQILYGPPGTGKTYNTVIYAVAICENKTLAEVENEDYNDVLARFNELRDKGQIEFVTFHQSYAYEEFMEGIKPYIPEWYSEEPEDVKYVGCDGIFKRLCQRAKGYKTEKPQAEIDFSKVKVFKMSLSPSSIYQYCLENNVIAMGWGGDYDYSGSEFKKKEDFDKYTNEKAGQIFRFKMWMNKGDLVIVPNGSDNIAAVGIITGDYEYDKDADIDYHHFRGVEWIYKGNLPRQGIYESKFVPPTLYELYQDKLNKDELKKFICGIQDAKKNYVLIIDEINRGNISKIFGELITLIEEDKRGWKVRLPYSLDADFYVPDNLYIIGTMNTADRSIVNIDIALRRRFQFVEMMPESSLLDDDVEGINLQKLLEKLNQNIRVLLDRDHQIGHAYFMKVHSVEVLKQVWYGAVLPLLNEYFYSDWENLKLLLQDFVEEDGHYNDESSFRFKNMEGEDFVKALKKFYGE